MPKTLIRPLGEDDWPLLKALRLRALSDSPDSFGTTYESAVVEPERYWRAWAKGQPGQSQAWAAFVNGETVGLVAAGMTEGAVGHCRSLWVAPEGRRSGLGRELIETACEWLARSGCGRVELDVTEGNPAERLYLALGFRRTGERQPLREGSALFEVTLVRDLPLRA